MKRLSEDKTGFLIGGGVLAGLLASVCCIGPLILTIIGVSGAAVLSKLDVLRWPMTMVVAAVFIYAGFILYRKPESCETGPLCSNPKKKKWLGLAYWLGLGLALAGITSPYWILWIFD